MNEDETVMRYLFYNKTRSLVTLTLLVMSLFGLYGVIFYPEDHAMFKVGVAVGFTPLILLVCAVGLAVVGGLFIIFETWNDLPKKKSKKVKMSKSDLETMWFKSDSDWDTFKEEFELMLKEKND